MFSNVVAGRADMGHGWAMDENPLLRQAVETLRRALASTNAPERGLLLEEAVRLRRLAAAYGDRMASDGPACPPAKDEDKHS